MKILVTGAAGFLGINLCKRFLERGDTVFGVDNFYSSDKNKLRALFSSPNFHFKEWDIIHPLGQLGNFDEIYHLACPASPPRYQKDGLYTLKTNFLGTMNLCELAIKNGSRFLYTSTSEIYGDPLEHPQRELYRGNVNTFGPRSCYDEGKRVGESLCFEYRKNKGLRVSVVRIFNTYGPYMDLEDGRVVTNFITQATAGEPLTVYGDGSQTRSLCYVSDLVEGFLCAIATDLPGPINLGAPFEYTVLELANMIKALTGSQSKIIFKPLPVDDPTRRCPDISLAKRLLKWEPKISLDEGLSRTIDWIKSVRFVV